MRTITCLVLCCVICMGAAAQKTVSDYTRLTGMIRLAEQKDAVFPLGEKGYSLVLPEGNKTVKGVVVSLEDERPDFSDTLRYKAWQNVVLAKDWALLYISSGVPVDLFFSPSSLKDTDRVLKELFMKFHLPKEQVVFLGVMTSGHRALRYIEYCQKGRSVFKPGIKGLVLCESAIDWVRQWYEGQKQVRDHLTEVGFFEGNMVTYLFNKNLKCTPATNIQPYLEFSPYSYFDTKMSKAVLFKDIPVHAFTYADTRYWFAAQGKGVFDSNYPDMSGFINEQKLKGNTRAVLTVFHSDPAEPVTAEMKKQSNTWSLVDKAALMDWIVAATGKGAEK
jgi:hypothetical protein